MPRSMVGLLAAVGAAMFALVAFAHGVLTWVIIVSAAAATGLAAFLALPPKKNSQVRFETAELGERADQSRRDFFDRRTGRRRTSRVWSVIPIGAEVLPWKISVKVERPQRSEDVRP
jgi:hypothetical protein